MSQRAWDRKPIAVQLMHTLMQLDLNDLQPRSWHIAQPYYYHPHSTECRIVIFGGNVHTNTSECSGDRVNTADLKILTFGKHVKAHTCISCIILLALLTVSSSHGEKGEWEGEG